jgi:hypothetical protein
MPRARAKPGAKQIASVKESSYSSDCCRRCSCMSDSNCSMRTRCRRRSNSFPARKGYCRMVLTASLLRVDEKSGTRTSNIDPPQQDAFEEAEPWLALRMKLAGDSRSRHVQRLKSQGRMTNRAEMVDEPITHAPGYSNHEPIRRDREFRFFNQIRGSKRPSKNGRELELRGRELGMVQCQLPVGT